MTRIVFIHGTRLTGAMWSAQVAGLAGEFETIAIDLPGHGRSAADTFTLERAAEAVDAAIGPDPGDRAIVVGLSLGGYVAMDVAARRPERVRGLVVSGATLEPVGSVAVVMRGLAEAMDRVAGQRLDTIQTSSFRRRYPSEIAEPIIDAGFWTRAGATALRAVAGQQFVPRLASYPGPSLLLNGEYDFVFRPSAPAFAAAAQDARRIRLGGASHLTNLDRPAAFNEAIRGFIRSL